MVGSTIRVEERPALLPAAHGPRNARPAFRQVLHRRHHNMVEKSGSAHGAPQGGFTRLREAGLKVHLGKCVFGAYGIDFLGHHISANRLEPQQDKLAAVRDLPSPTDLSRLRAALGLFSYYRKFVPHFSTIAFPLNSLMKKDRPWEWGEHQEEAFIELKEHLCSAAVLRLPDPYSC